MENQKKSSADAASPGPLENEKQWKRWDEKFVNYVRSHIGANSVPLSYVIRDNEEIDINGEHLDFINKTVDCAPLEGEYYAYYRMSVFDMVVSFTTGQLSGDWIKSTMKHSDRQRSKETLSKNFTGEGSATRNIAEAESLDK